MTAELKLAETEPPETKITGNPQLREKFEKLYKRYQKGEVPTIDDLARGMGVSPRTINSTVKRLKWQSALKSIEEEAQEEQAKKYKVFAVRKGKRGKGIYDSPIPDIENWIKRTLNDLRPKTRMIYVNYATRCWKYLVEKYGLYNPVLWTRKELEEFIYSDRIRKLEKSTQNKVRTSINSLLKSLGKRDIFFPKLEEKKVEVVYMSEETKRTFFNACLEDYQEGIIPFTVAVIALKTGTRIGSDVVTKDAEKPENDRGITCIRMHAIDLAKKPAQILVRDKGNYTWVKLLDDEGERYLREYLAWRQRNRPEWKDNPFLFGDTRYSDLKKRMEQIRKKYDLYELDRWGNKRWIHWHMFRDNFANECLLAMSGEPEDGKEPEMDKGVLACCQLGGWNDPKTFVDRYVATETIERLKKLWFKKVENRIGTGLD